MRRGRARFGTQHLIRIPPRDTRGHVPAECFQSRYAGSDVSDVDHEDSRHGIKYPNPRQVFGLDLPSGNCPSDSDASGDDPEPH